MKKQFNIKKLFNRFMTSFISFIRKALILCSMFSFPVLFVLVFYYLFTGRPLQSIACGAALAAFLYMNKEL